MAKKGKRSKQGKVRVVRRRRVFYYAPPSPAARKFRTFEHDFHTILEASVRAGTRSPAAMVRDAELAADRMAEVVEARRPSNDPNVRFHYRRRISPWREWSHLFDRMVHSMSERTSLSPAQVVKRSEAIADLAIRVLRTRRRSKEPVA